MDRTDSRPLRVLAVDDNRDAADSVRLLAELWGYDARAAYDGQTALAAADAFDPDVMLLDLGLPRVDGFEVARRVRAGRAAGRPMLVAVTGYTDPGVRPQATAAGFDHVLVKPVDPAGLRELMFQAGRLAPLARETRALAAVNAELVRRNAELAARLRASIRGLRDDGAR